MLTVPAKLAAVTLGVSNFETMRGFYRELGWTEGTSSGEPYAVFRTAGAFVALFPVNALAADANAPTDRFKGQTFAMYVDRAEQVDETIDELRRGGVSIAKEPAEAFGGRSAYFVDPEENYWEVAWLPTVRFDERGALTDL